MRIALVGHCGPDMFMLRSAIGRHVPDAEIVTLDRMEDVESSVGSVDLYLVNRVLDGSFRNRSGIDLIAAMGAESTTMLVSNFADAQRDAEAAGARPGFGKSELYDAIVGDRLRAALSLS